MQYLFLQDVQQALENANTVGDICLTDQNSQLVQHISEELLQDMQLWEEPSQVTSKFGAE